MRRAAAFEGAELVSLCQLVFSPDRHGERWAVGVLSEIRKGLIA